MKTDAAVLDETKLGDAIADVTGSMPAIVMRRIVDHVLVLVREAGVRVGTLSMICVPLRRGDMPVGVLKVSAAHAHAFDGNDVSGLGKLARFITAAISAASNTAVITDELLADGAPSARRHASSVPGGTRAFVEFGPPARGSEFVANVLRPGPTICGRRVRDPRPRYRGRSHRRRNRDPFRSGPRGRRALAAPAAA